jgi:hypothetical protein
VTTPRSTHASVTGMIALTPAATTFWSSEMTGRRSSSALASATSYCLYTIAGNRLILTSWSGTLAVVLPAHSNSTTRPCSHRARNPINTW